MKILLCYSKDHFNPLLKEKAHETWGISANLLAREFYNALQEFGEVTYSDGYDYEKHAGESYDLFVGIERNFHKILEVCKIKKSILIAVNMHPLERNQILTDFVAEQLAGQEQAIANGDLVDSQSIEMTIEKADYIFCLGNNATYNSYIKHGVPRTKIKTFNYGLPSDPAEPGKPSQEKRFLYAASGIGLRKGFDIVESLIGKLDKTTFHLDIVGRPTNDYYAQKVEDLAKRNPKTVTYHGYVPAKSKKYEKLFLSSDFLLFPTLEEGQAGTVIEAMYFGLVPILTAAAGTDFAPLGFMEPVLNAPKNTDIIKKALTLTLDETWRLKQATLNFYKEFHTNLGNHLKEAIGNCLQGNLYPKVSLILPIYNKAETIKGLIELLDAAGQEYKNIETHIIFDGCSDKSEQIVRKYFKNSDQSVKFYTTPNIFEVKSNNIGFLRSTGKYAVIIQDDNYIYDKYFLFEAVNFLDKDPTCAVLGGLAGVNFYPIGTTNEGQGQIMSNDYESYWRQDENTDPELKNRIFEVDACMRGPLIFRKSFLQAHGCLDEVFAPLYQDDMDICFRTRKYGYKVYCMIMDVANKSLTMANYNSEKAQYFARIMQRNAAIFYERWVPTKEKNYGWLQRIELWRSATKPKARKITKHVSK